MDAQPFDCFTQLVFVEDVAELSNIIFVPGASRRQLIDRAVDLYRQGVAPLILPSGGPNQRIPDWPSEWSYLSHIAIEAGVPQVAILREEKAKNTFENARFSSDVVASNGLSLQRAILVAKAHHSRRALLTYQTEFPNIQFRVSPIVDEREITKDNWHQDQRKIDVVMSEMEKIGRYFGKHVCRWSEGTR